MSNLVKKITKLYESEKTVFTVADLFILWEIENKNVLKTIVSRAVKKNHLIKIRRGLYCLNEEKVNSFELAGKLQKNSYLSFETVLASAGVIFQYYDEIISANYRNKDIRNQYGKFKYRSLPKDILLNRTGILNKDSYFIATPERSLCDKVYKDGVSYFDNLSGLNHKLLKEISKIYNNKRLEKEIKKLCE